MAPSNTTEGSKSSKMIVKRLWNKLLTPKEKVKKDKPDDDWVLDSVPDYACEENINCPTEQTKIEQGHSEEARKNKENVPESDEKSKKEEETSGTKPTHSDAPPAQIIYNLNVTDGKVHIGPKTVQTYNVQQNFNAGPTKKGAKSEKKKKMSKTPQIEALLQSSVKLDFAHITYLSKHFGNKWRDVGLALEFSNGDLDRLENQNRNENDLSKVSFEMLNAWMMRNGDLATVGQLCVKLWNSRIVYAREAVKLLADNFADFD